MGGDQAVIAAARICYDSESRGLDSDRKLIERLLGGEIKHNTPIEHSVFRFKVKCPIFVARQWLRHRIGTFNERSLRHCLAEEDYYIPRDFNIYEEDMYKKAISHALQAYKNLVDLGYRREVARGVLPFAVYTRFIWTVNAWSLMNWLQKRLDKAAQWEHRQYAKAILKIFLQEMPITANAFCKYIYLSEEGREEDNPGPN